MPSIKCTICGKEISPNAVSCPNCGDAMNKSTVVCNLVLISSGKQNIRVVKEIRDITGWSIKEAKNAVDYPPSIIVGNVDYLRGLEYKTQFDGLGAVVDLMPTDKEINTPTSALDIKCPNCSSSHTKKISAASKAVSALFRFFSAGKLKKSYECKKCGYRW